ncbi:MAG: hypothetical protein ACE14V_12660 [bacterium]
MVSKSGSIILISLGLFGLISVYGIAQTEPPSVPTGYQLTYQFQSGETLKYKITTKGAGSMSIRESDKSYYGLMTAISLPITTQSQSMVTMNVRSVTPEGIAEIETKVASMNSREEILGHALIEKYTNGIYECYADDVLEFTSVTTNKPIPFLINPIAYKIDNRGKQFAFAEMKWLNQYTPDLDDGLYFMDFNDMVLFAEPGLPAYQLHPGDSWAATTDLKIPKLKIKPIKVVIESSLSSIDTVNGSPYAVIENFWNVDISDWKFDLLKLKEFEDILPNIKLKRMQEMISGKSYHLLNKGKVTKGEYIQNYIMELSVKPPKMSQHSDFEALFTIYLADNVTIELVE